MGQTKADETKPCEPKPKKMVRRSVAIALGTVCILLIAVIAAFSIAGISAQNSYGNLQNQNTRLQAWLDGNETLLNQTETWLGSNITYYDSQIANLTNQLNQSQTWLNGNITAYNSYVADHHHTDEDYTNFYNISSLVDSTVWVNDQTISQPAGASTSWTDSVNYAGYVSIAVLSSTSSSTYAHVAYSADGVNYDNTTSVGTTGTAYFPVLPSSSITVEVGNKNVVNGATETVTITYYY